MNCKKSQGRGRYRQPSDRAALISIEKHTRTTTVGGWRKEEKAKQSVQRVEARTSVLLPTLSARRRLLMPAGGMSKMDKSSGWGVEAGCTQGDR